jgi:hypothetical protein
VTRRESDRPAVSLPDDPERRSLFEEHSSATGIRWSEEYRSDLRKEGRAAAGGFPGTLSEARALVTSILAAELGRRRLVALSIEEREWAARATYAAARKDWLQHGDREDEIELDD